MVKIESNHSHTWYKIQDGDGVTVSLAWITGSLSSWSIIQPCIIMDSNRKQVAYTATAFVWESVDNPTALSPPVSTTISCTISKITSSNFPFFLFLNTS